MMENKAQAGCCTLIERTGQLKRYISLIGLLSDRLRVWYYECGFNSAEINGWLTEVATKSFNGSCRSGKEAGKNELGDVIRDMLTENRDNVEENLTNLIDQLEAENYIISQFKNSKPKQQAEAVSREPIEAAIRESVLVSRELKPQSIISVSDVSDQSSSYLSSEFMLSRKASFRKYDESDSTDGSLKRNSDSNSQIPTSLRQLMYKTKLLRNLLETKLATRYTEFGVLNQALSLS